MLPTSSSHFYNAHLRGLQDIFSSQKNVAPINNPFLFKICNYFKHILPFTFKNSSTNLLCGRISPKLSLSIEDLKVNDSARKVMQNPSIKLPDKILESLIYRNLQTVK